MDLSYTAESGEMPLKVVNVKLPLFSPSRFRKTIVPVEVISALDSIKDLAFVDQEKYYSLRNKLFPEDKSGSLVNLNRAGDKLEEIWGTYLNGSGRTGKTFFDIAGAPGSWSRFLIQKRFTGYGISLESSVIKWYPSVIKDLRFKKICGILKDGDLYNCNNIDSINVKVDLCVCDGGLGEDKMKELWCFRLFLGEAILSMKSLVEGGDFVIKIYDTFTYLTCSFLYLLSRCFREFHIVKPKKSRVVNGEKYCCGLGFKMDMEVYDILNSVYRNFDDREIPWRLVEVPGYFENKLKSFTEEHVENQLNAFKTILENF